MKEAQFRVLDENFIDNNRGKPVLLIRFEQIKGKEPEEFIKYLHVNITGVLEMGNVEFAYKYLTKQKCLLMGIVPEQSWSFDKFPNIENAIGRFLDKSVKSAECDFDFGVARTMANYISESEEILTELYKLARKNLHDNRVRWSWTYFNRAKSYIAGSANEALIQPTFYYDSHIDTFSVKGGEVFVGGGFYNGYQDIIKDIPKEQDLNRIELLILEKLLLATSRSPGILKYNISPESLIHNFHRKDRMLRFCKMLQDMDIRPENIMLELVEKPYDDSVAELKDVCKMFSDCGIKFAADDFGLRSQSHQVILDLGVMIKEIKLDPMSFKWEKGDDKTRFLDNLAFIDYCKKLADNRDAVITAEAVADYDSLIFLMEHRVDQFQTNLFCSKLTIEQYRNDYLEMQGLPGRVVFQILKTKELMELQNKNQNIFRTAREAGLFP